MWNQSASSKLVQDRIHRKVPTVGMQSYDKHRHSLTQIRSTIDTSSPKRPHFVYNKYKELMKEEDRQFEIRTNNAILVQKMMNQKLGEFHHLHNPVFGRQSLNRVVANRRATQIVSDNKLIMQKLTNSRATYNTRQILQTTNKHLQYMSNISQNARRCKSTRGFDDSRSQF